MRLAYFNIQNLFFRHRDLIEQKQHKCRRQLLSEMDNLLQLKKKGRKDLTRMEEIVFLLGFENQDEAHYGLLKSRGAVLKLNKLTVSASDRAGIFNKWNGWIEMQNREIDPLAVRNKCRVITDAQADILILEEVEDYESLEQFNQLLEQFPNQAYNRSMVIQGNDRRGINQGVLCKHLFKTKHLEWHGHDQDDSGKRIFDTNCTTVKLFVAGDQSLWIISSSFTRKDAKNKEETDSSRLVQSSRVKEIYQELLDRGEDLVAVCGTFYAPSYCFSVSPLFRETDLRDITRHPAFSTGLDRINQEYHALGSYRRGVNLKQEDYMLLSPALFKQIRQAGIIRKGIWPGKDRQWDSYATLQNLTHQASKHPLIWADLEI